MYIESYMYANKNRYFRLSSNSRDRIVVSTSRCGRDNPGSNPGHGISSCGVCVMAQLSNFFPSLFKLYSLFVVQV